MTRRLFVLIYGIACYAIFLVTFLYAIGFVGNFLVPRSIDSPAEGRLRTNLLIDVGLLLLFAVQHSGMARPVFKNWVKQYIGEPAERSTYVLAASIALLVLFVCWRPLGGMVWSVTQPWLAGSLNLLCALGWLLVLASTFLLDHFDLFGLRQVWSYYRSTPSEPVSFRTPGPYKLVRHPLYLGFIFAFWASPTMTVTHLFFALATTLYILVAIQLEERDLIANLGEAYSDYRRRVPMIVPSVRRRS